MESIRKLSATWINTCIDIGLRIPPIITEFDRINKAYLSPESKQAIKYILLEEAIFVKQSLDASNARLYQSFNTLFPWERPTVVLSSAPKNEVNPTQCDPSDHNLYLFPTWDIAASFLSQAMIRIAPNYLLIELSKSNIIPGTQKMGINGHTPPIYLNSSQCPRNLPTISVNLPSIFYGMINPSLEDQSCWDLMRWPSTFVGIMRRFVTLISYPKFKKACLLYFRSQFNQDLVPLPLWEHSFKFTSF
ncbi:hypothetical protein K3495_g12308 [Podosphaera aphanis]|nr:hypothetical protein K3495_g12308 [Podosphaera aphanis]